MGFIMFYPSSDSVDKKSAPTIGHRPTGSSCDFATLTSDIMPRRRSDTTGRFRELCLTRLYKGRERKAMSWHPWHRKIMGTMWSTCCEPLDD